MMKKRFYISVVYIGLSFSCIFLTSCEMLNQLRQKNTTQPSNQRINETVLRKVVKRWDPSFIYRAGVD